MDTSKIYQIIDKRSMFEGMVVFIEKAPYNEMFRTFECVYVSENKYVPGMYLTDVHQDSLALYNEGDHMSNARTFIKTSLMDLVEAHHKNIEKFLVYTPHDEKIIARGCTLDEAKKHASEVAENGATAIIGVDIIATQVSVTQTEIK